MTEKSSANSITVWLVEDNRHFTEAIECILESEEGITLKESFRSAEAVLKTLKKKE